MRFLSFIMAFFAAGFALTAIDAYAEIVRGEIKEVNALSNYVKLERADSKFGKPEEIQVGIEPSTQFNGATSLEELKIGDLVTVEADQNVLTRHWKARMINVATL